MSKIFYIFRHGETLVSKKGGVYGDTVLTAEILPEGKLVIEKLAKYLKDIPTDFYVSSEILRCRQTVEIVSQITGKQFVFDSRLNELYDETIEEFILKVRQFLDEVKHKPCQNILICTHGAVIALLTELITLGNLKSLDVTHYPNPGVLRIIRDGQIQDLDFN